MTHTVTVSASKMSNASLPDYEQGIIAWLEIAQITDWEVDFVRTHIITDDIGRPLRKRGPYWLFQFGNADDAMLFKLMWGGK